MKLRKLVLICAFVGAAVGLLACVVALTIYVIFIDPVGMQ